MRKGRLASLILWAVYGLVAAATFRHSAWAFGTLESTSLAPILTLPGATFWITGGMAAAAVDAGMVGIVLAIKEGSHLKRLYFGLVFVMFCSAYTQFLWAITHAVPISEMTFNVADWIWVYAVSAWVWRVVVLPFLLPGLGLFYAFTAKLEQPKRSYRRKPKEKTIVKEGKKIQGAKRLDIPPKGDF